VNLFPPWLKRTVGYCVAFLVVIATVWVVTQILLAVPVVFYSVASALLLAAMLTPVTGRLVDRGLPRWLGALLSVLLLLGLVLGTMTVVVRRALGQVNDLRSALGEALGGLQTFLTGPPLSLSESRVSSVRQRLSEFARESAPSPGAGATLVLELLSGVAIAIFVLFFLLKDGPRMWRWVLGWTPAHRRDLMDLLGSRSWDTLIGYAVGMIVVAFVDALIIGTGLAVMGVPLVMSLALLVFLGAFVPVVGATVSGALAVAVTAATVGVWQAAVVLGVVLLAQQLEGNLVQPLVMGRAVQLHPVVIVLAVTAGAVLGGVGGAVIAVPVVAVAYRALDQLIGPAGKSATPASAAPSEP
jgi:predicted PurR-regulated permease PerM